MSRIHRIEQTFARKEIPAFDVGDTVDVHVLIREGDKERVQIFNGTVLRRRGEGMSATYTVRRIVQGDGVERTFPVHSPAVQKVVVRRTGRVRRSRLYYLRERTGKATRLREVLDLKRPEAAGGARPAVAEPPVPAAVVPEPEATAAAE